MRLILLLFVVLSFLGCSKKKIENTYFERFIGVWLNDSTDELVTIEIKANGILKISKSIERQEKYRIKSFQFDGEVNGKSRYIFEISNEKIPADQFFKVFQNSTKDSIYFDHGILTNDGQLIYNHGFKKIE
jgi:hypothetical protein